MFFGAVYSTWHNNDWKADCEFDFRNVISTVLQMDEYPQGSCRIRKVKAVAREFSEDASSMGRRLQARRVGSSKFIS